MKLGLAIGLAAALLYGDLGLYIGTSADTCRYDDGWQSSETLETVTHLGFWLLLGLLFALVVIALSRLARRFVRPS